VLVGVIGRRAGRKVSLIGDLNSVLPVLFQVTDLRLCRSVSVRVRHYH